tara:strand:+ start:4123 stop:5295 length:1173 start_codon:yes stop_codon:yes gene_type:complete
VKKTIAFLLLTLFSIFLTACVSEFPPPPPGPADVGILPVPVGKAIAVVDGYAPPYDVFDKFDENNNIKQTFFLDNHEFSLAPDTSSFDLGIRVAQEGAHIYKIAYVYHSAIETWKAYELSGEDSNYDGWKRHEATTSITINTNEINPGRNYVAVYSCPDYYKYNDWKCGCVTTDGTCGNFMMQVFNYEISTEPAVEIEEVTAIEPTAMLPEFESIPLTDIFEQIADEAPTEVYKKPIVDGLNQENDNVVVDIPADTTVYGDNANIDTIQAPVFEVTVSLIVDNVEFEVLGGITTLGNTGTILVFDKPVTATIPGVIKEPEKVIYSVDNKITWKDIALCNGADPSPGGICYDYLPDTQSIKVTTYHFTHLAPLGPSNCIFDTSTFDNCDFG